MLSGLRAWQRDTRPALSLVTSYSPRSLLCIFAAVQRLLFVNPSLTRYHQQQEKRRRQRTLSKILFVLCVLGIINCFGHKRPSCYVWPELSFACENRQPFHLLLIALENVFIVTRDAEPEWVCKWEYAKYGSVPTYRPVSLFGIVLQLHMAFDFVKLSQTSC